ncbi:hypothetical protein ACFOOT_03330 [Novosphingobium pokkalii]|uniref:Transposase n=1 Tax=Novosphingobium pokkalii TaxID=1770194 RepID=A0ABV7V071_9SPHN
MQRTSPCIATQIGARADLADPSLPEANTAKAAGKGVVQKRAAAYTEPRSNNPLQRLVLHAGQAVAGCPDGLGGRREGLSKSAAEKRCHVRRTLTDATKWEMFA